MAVIQTMFPPSSERPMSQYSQSANIGIKDPKKRTGLNKTVNGLLLAGLRDNFTIPTWILIGCTIQTLLTLLFPRSWTTLTLLLLLAWRIGDPLLMHFGLKRNPYMDGVVVGKFAVAYPGSADSDGRKISGRPAENGPGAVMILGARSNSPMGAFADGLDEVGQYFRKMLQELDHNKENNGFMGMSSWVAAGERASCNESSTISYWRSIEDIHNFSLSPIHREAWNWWNDTLPRHKHIGIMHEIFAIPEKGGWEGIYVNYHPTGLAATTKWVPNADGKAIEGEKSGGEKGGVWVNPIVDARRGVYKSSHGRMNRGDADGSANDAVTKDPYNTPAYMNQ